MLELFLTMLKIGFLTFGGGYAMIGVITHEFVDKKKWITNEEMLDMIAISESLPGAIAINTSISVGYKIKGVKGSVAAVLGVVIPSITVITVVTYLYNSLPQESPVWLFVKGIRAGVAGLMAAVILKLGSAYEKSVFAGVMFVVAFCAAMFTPIPVIFIIIAGAIAGFMYGRWVKNDTA